MTSQNEIEILLVEDNPHDAEMTLRVLNKHQLAHKSHHVKNGVEALDFVFATGAYAYRDRASKPRLILLDLKLPKIDGFEVLRRIKSDENAKSIPVVVLTSSKEERDVTEAYRLGVNSYVVKPVIFEKFVEAVSRLGLYWVFTNYLP